MKKTVKIMGIVLLALLILIAFHTLNRLYPNNIVHKILNGVSLVLTPILLAAVLAYLVNPLTQWLITKWKIGRKYAVILTLILLLIASAAIIYFVVVFFIDQGRAVYHAITKAGFFETIREWFASKNIENIYIYVEDFLKNYDYQKVLSSSSSVVRAVGQGFTTIILVPIFLWHIMSQKEVFFNKVSDNLPANWREHVIPILNKSNIVVAGYFKSKIISILFLFVVFTIFYLILGMPAGYVIFFAALIAILDIIPYIGPIVGLAVPIIYIFASGGVNFFYKEAMHVNAFTANVVLLLVNFAIQLFQGNYVMPKLAGKQMNLHSALILVFMLFFGSILGIWGVVLSIPLGGIIIVIWNHFKERSFLKSNIEEEVEDS
jgi:predicted PurR-regulated permease PerM